MQEVRQIGRRSPYGKVTKSERFAQKETEVVALCENGFHSWRDVSLKNIWPVRPINIVATTGAVPLKIVKLTLKTSATPVKRTRVGKRSVSSTANAPFVSPALRPASTQSSVRFIARISSAL